MVEDVVDSIGNEVGQIEKLFTVYADLLQRVQQREPDQVEIAAVASVLHSFYNGLENIFLVVVKNIDLSIPSGSESHQDLLTQISQGTRNRSQVISRESARKLSDYLAFRHFYRHSYTFLIDWRRLKKLVIQLNDVWARTRGELISFMNSLGSKSNGSPTMEKD